jgi:hypothetical protein
MRSHIMSVSTVVLLSLVLQTSFVHCQGRQSMILGGTNVSLGMKKADVFKSFGEVDLRADSITNGNDSWVVTQKDRLSGKMESIGVVQFSAGRLSLVEKDWGQADGEDAVEVLTSLYSAIRSLTSGDGSVGVIRTYENDEPGITVKSIEITIQGRSFTVGITKDTKLKQQQVYVQEQIPEY